MLLIENATMSDSRFSFSLFFGVCVFVCVCAHKSESVGLEGSGSPPASSSRPSESQMRITYHVRLVELFFF